MIKYVKDGHSFVSGGSYTSTHYREVDKEEYERLQKMSYGERTEEIEEDLSASIKYGYGYYGHNLCKENGKFYMGITSGNSCDQKGEYNDENDYWY